MTSKPVFTLIMSAALLAPSAAWAEDRDFGSAGGFDVFGQGSTRDQAGGCMATFEYEGPGSTKTSLFRSLDVQEGTIVYFQVVNFEWSADENQTYPLSFIFDDGQYDRDANGVKDGLIYRGFMSGFPGEEFLDTYAKSSSLHIYMGETVIDKFDLSGSAAGVALFRRCWSWVLGTERAAQVERDKFADIPRDPFAKKDKGDE